MKKSAIQQIATIVLFFYCSSIFASSFSAVQVASATGRGITLTNTQEAVYNKEISQQALVIGNSEYSSSPLRNPHNDATDMAHSLQQLGFEVTLLVNAGKQDMVNAVREFTGTLKEHRGVGFFYYAGHGMQIAGRNYLIPIDADIKHEHDVKYEGLDVGRVLDGMENAGNGTNILVLDACRNNPYARSFRSSSQGLAQIDTPAGTLLSYSTSPGHIAKDGDERNGVFTEHLLREMMIPGLNIESTFKRVRAGVMAATNNEQTPWESSSLTTEFYFRGGDGKLKIEYTPTNNIDQRSVTTGSSTISTATTTIYEPSSKTKYEFKKPWYKRWYVWLGVAVVALVAASSLGGGGGGEGGKGGGNGGDGGDGG